ncbi:MAG: hypothetical protein V3V33_12560 [Candidatus Lokiarchaeia archaeon]
MVQRWIRQSQLLNGILSMNSQGLSTTVNDITLFLMKNDSDIDINIVDSSIRHYRKSRLLRRKRNPYKPNKHPFEYELTELGFNQIDYLIEILSELYNIN